jgi:hypothetical protein
MRKPNRATRVRIENAIQAMIDAHDVLDPDPEMEPSLGSLSAREEDHQEFWGWSDRSDHEDEHDGREPPEDNEPSLGSFDRLVNQDHSWRQRVWSFVDAEHDTADREPSLGSIEHGAPASQVFWGKSDRSDGEDEHDGYKPQECSDFRNHGS